MTYLEINLWLTDPHGQVIASTTGSTYSSSFEVPLEATVQETGNYVCHAYFWADWNYLGPGDGFFQVRLRAYEIQIDALIPEDNTDHPFRADRVYEGDDRPEWWKSGSYRTRQTLRIIGPAASVYLIDDGPWNETGPSAIYEKSSSLSGGRLTGEAKSDWIPGSPLKVDWDQAAPDPMNCSTSKASRSEMTINCTLSVSNPLVWSGVDWASSITYEFQIRLTFSGDQNVYYEVTGAHDGFPNYGIWIGDQRIYDYYHGSQTPFSLQPPMEMSAYRSGVLQ